MIQFKFLKAVEAIPIVVPFAKWQMAANWDEFTNQPRKS